MPSITARIAATAAAAVALAATPGVVATGLSAAQSRVSATATVVPATGATTEDQSTWTRRHGGSPGYGGQGLGSSGSGSSGSDATGSSDLSRAADGSTISGTEVASMKGVVMVDTVLPDGRGAGTGMILSAGGEVLTNYHVVEGSTSITVTDTTTGRTYPATVVGHDAAHDVAVLRLSGASGLSTVTVDRSPAQVVRVAVKARSTRSPARSRPSTRPSPRRTRPPWAPGSSSPGSSGRRRTSCPATRAARCWTPPAG